MDLRCSCREYLGRRNGVLPGHVGVPCLLRLVLRLQHRVLLNIYRLLQSIRVISIRLTKGTLIRLIGGRMLGLRTRRIVIVKTRKLIRKRHPGIHQLIGIALRSIPAIFSRLISGFMHNIRHIQAGKKPESQRISRQIQP